MRIAHLSDIHFGRIAYPDIVDALLAQIERDAVDLIAISGDLTQRALPTQYREAARMLASIHTPTIVVPGNHDVLAWWRPLSRVLRPLARYHRYISPGLTMSFENERVAVLGINSAYGSTIKGGRISRATRASIRTYFEGRPAAAFKILVVHHQLTAIGALGPHDVARGGDAALDVAREVGVDLILCGHLHVSHVESLKRHPAEARIVVASAGTVTSDRGRLSNRNKNYYNVIEVEPDSFTIVERCYDTETRVFVDVRRSHFERGPGARGAL
ncbi:MAG: metallophosphoesterase [Rhodothermales bacterium]|nr:metallophosphoesterase [Rhodothermales bacterium]